MKQIFTLLIMLMAFTLLAQETNTNYILGGSLNFFTQKNTYPSNNFFLGQGSYSNSTDDSKSTTFSIRPYFGREVTSHWLLGFSLPYAYRVSEYKTFEYNSNRPPFGVEIERKTISNDYGVEIFGRYNLKPQNEFNFYLQPYLGYTASVSSSKRDGSESSKQDISYLKIGVEPGITWNVSERFRLLSNAGSLRYITGNSKTKDNPDRRNFSSLEAYFHFSSIYFGIEFKL